MIWAIERQSKIGWFVTGVLAGLAVGMKPTGLIMLGVLVPCIVFAPQRRTVLSQSWILLAGFALAVAPLAIHNYKAAGTVFWPDLRTASSANATFRFGGESWNAAAYDPTIPTSSVHAFSNEWCKRRVRSLYGFTEVFLHPNSIVPMWLLPFVFYAFVRHMGAWRRAGYVCQRPQDIFVAATFLLTCGAFCLGAMVHVSSRYWNFLVPVFAVVGISVCAKHAREFVVFALLIGVAFSVEQMRRVIDPFDDPRTALVAKYRTLDSLIPEKAVVMTSNPWEFSFHTRRLSVVLPYNSKDEVVQDVALRYGVEYLVIIDRDARHPGFNKTECVNNFETAPVGN